MWDICYYWYLLSKSFKFQANVCNECHDLSRMSMNLSTLLFQTLKVLVIAALLAKLANLKP